MNIKTIKAKKLLTRPRNKLILVILFIAVGLLFNRYVIKGSGENKELSLAKAKVGKLILLPTNEEPTLAEVTDNKTIKDAVLAKSSKNGDQILFYTKSRLVVVYRPSINKIVLAGDLFADPAYSEADGATIIVMNGNNDDSKTQGIIADIKRLYPNSVVSFGGKTVRSDFPKTIVIDNTSKKDNFRSALIQDIKGNLGVVPLSETKTDSDIMIIVGKD